MTGRRHSQFKRILIGFDGSSQSEKATEIGSIACPIARFKSAPLCRRAATRAGNDGRSECHAR